MSLIHTQKILVQSTGGVVDNAAPNLFDGTNSIASTLWSTPLWVKQYDRLTLQFSTPSGSTLVGAVTMEGSDDAGKMESLGKLQTPGDTALNWSTLSFFDEVTFATVITKAIASGAQSFIFTVPSFGVRWWRMKFTFTSGAGLVTATVQMKGTSGK